MNEKDMNLEDLKRLSNCPVMWHELISVLEQTINSNTEGQQKIMDSITKIVETCAEYSEKLYKESEYNRMRDLYFWKQLLSTQSIPKESVFNDCYQKYCVEFDKLNKKEDENND